MKAVEGGDVFLIPGGVNPVREEALKELGKVTEGQGSSDATTTSTDAEADPATDAATADDASADEAKGAGNAPEARTVPPLGAILITESDVDKAVDWFDDEFPELAGLLDAEVVEGE